MKVPEFLLTINFFSIPKENKQSKRKTASQASKQQVSNAENHDAYNTYGNLLCTISEQQQQVAKGYRDTVHSRITC